jgi:hypothetical protein
LLRSESFTFPQSAAGTQHLHAYSSASNVCTTNDAFLVYVDQLHELRGDPRLKHSPPAVIALVLFDHLCSVYPRFARINRTPTKIKECFAEGKNADRVSRVDEALSKKRGVLALLIHKNM